MQEVLESIQKLKSLPAEAAPREFHSHLIALREGIAARLKAASQSDADLFRDVIRSLVAFPAALSPELRAELILEVAQYFYFAGLPFEAIERTDPDPTPSSRTASSARSRSAGCVVSPR